MALINLRNALMAWKRLPYDAEIEYLESTGTQYIDTGILGTANTRLECDAAFLPSSENNYIGQTYSSSTSPLANRFALGVNSHNRWYAGLGNVNSTTNVTADNARHSFTLDAPTKKFNVDGSTIYTINFTSWTESASPIGGLALFGRNRTDTGAISPFAIMRCYQCKIYDNNVLIRDFIPVRVGTVGYLYDRVSGQLFGNAGTGAFVVGPDKSAAGGGV